MARPAVLALLALIAANALAAQAARQPEELQLSAPAGGLERRRHKGHPYTSPAGLFIQERASKQLPGPGQHFSFGALKPWEDVLALLDEEPASTRKLLLVVRHGQAVSNYLGDTLGPDEWFVVEGTCQYDDKQGTVYNIFDADLTQLGQDQAKSLNSILVGGGWFAKMSGGRPVRAVISPLTRCLHTATLVLEGIRPNATSVEEFVRETLGEDTCDARRSVSDPNTGAGSGSSGGAPESPCSFDKGLRSTYPQYSYQVWDPEDDADRGFGLLGDADHLWTKDTRERQKHQVKRAKKFLDIVFDHAPEQVVVVITHSGFTRSLLLAVQREPYRPQNAEMVPVVVDKHQRRGAGGFDEDAWAEEVLAGLREEELAALLQEGGEGEGPAHGAQRPQQQQQQRQQRGSGCPVRWLSARLAALLQKAAGGR